MYVQRSLGNRLLQSIVGGQNEQEQTAAEMGNPILQRTCACGGSCTACRREDEHQHIQTKLTIGQPDDMYEQEADRVAEQVMRMPDPHAAPIASINRLALPQIRRMCPACDHEFRRSLMKTEEGEIIQAQPARGHMPQITPHVQNYITSIRGGGQPLPREARSFFEPRFGYDFGHVRIHTDARAAESARAVHALAYTVGPDIVFGWGHYMPGTNEGRKLLAHELTHVLQQQGTSIQRRRTLSNHVDTIALAMQGPNSLDEPRIPISPIQAGNMQQVQRLPGSPAGGCGLCYGKPNLVGLAAHSLIAAEFKRQYRWLQTEHPFPVLIPSLLDKNGRLDLADVILGDEDEVAIGEIKPDNDEGWLEGEKVLQWYGRQLAKFGHRVTRLTLWPPYKPIRFRTLAPPDCPQYQELYVNPPVRGVYTYWCRPDYAELIRECDCRRGHRRPVRVPETVPVPIPERERDRGRQVEREQLPILAPGPTPIPASRETLEDIADFIRQTARSTEDAEEAARRFLMEHPKARYVLIGAAITIVVATLIETFATSGVGLLNDPASIAVAFALVRVAQTGR